MGLILSKDLVQVRMNVVPHMLYVLAIGDVLLHGDTHFEFEPMKWHKSGQLKSKLKIRNFRTNICLPCPVLSQDTEISFLTWSS